jgi:hypothetical protein
MNGQLAAQYAASAWTLSDVPGTIPTLVVPMIETTGTGMDTRFRSLRDTIVGIVCRVGAQLDPLDHLRLSRPGPRRQLD